MTQIQLTRCEEFCASHRLYNPEWSDEKNREIFGRCSNEHGHGHNYILEVTVRGTPDPGTGMVINFDLLKSVIRKSVIDDVDHCHLNLDVPEFKELMPTVENMCVVFWNRLELALPKGLLHEITLRETGRNSATYRG